LETLEKFLCRLYNSRKFTVNQVRYELFQKKYTRESKVIDLTLLPPCKPALNKHIQRANYIARIWKCCDTANVPYPHPSQHGWNSHCEIEWCNEIFPEDVRSIVLEANDCEDDLYEVGSDKESSEDDADDDSNCCLPRIVFSLHVQILLLLSIVLIYLLLVDFHLLYFSLWSRFQLTLITLSACIKKLVFINNIYTIKRNSHIIHKF